jgi:hypothetical protein
VDYTPLHRDLLLAVEAGAVVFYDPGKFHLIAGFRVHEDVERGLGWLLVAGYTELGDPSEGDLLPVLITPLGEAAKRRWDREQGQAGSTGGAK